MELQPSSSSISPNKQEADGHILSSRTGFWPTCLGLIQAMGAVLDLCGSWQMPDSAGFLKTTIGTLQAGQVGIDTDMIIQE